MTIPEETPIPLDARNGITPSRFRIRFGLVLTFLGLFVFLFGVNPGILGLDRGNGVGFVQIAVFLVGLGIICFGGFTCLIAFWKNGSRTIAADIGLRLVATGYVVSVVSGMADVFGMGTQPFPRIPFFGPWQSVGIDIGMVIIAIGFLLLIPYRKPQPHNIP